MNRERQNLKTADIGKEGEIIAAEYLCRKGFELLYSNYRFRKAEIDLIGINDHILVFVEVKYRTNISFGLPESFVSISKQNRIKAAAENYIFENNWVNDIRFDIISIVNNKTNLVIEHFTDCF